MGIYINDFISPMKRKYSNMTFLSEFSVQTEFDETECEIEQVAVLKCGAIIVTDIKNAFAKAFTMDGKYLDTTKNVGRVFGIAATGYNTFVVTVYGKTMVAFYELRTDGKLSLQSLIDTDRRYFGIGVLPNNEFVAGTKNAINILTQKLKTIGSMTSEFNFVNPYHIKVTNSGKVIVADSEKKCIVVFDQEGCKEFHIHLGHKSLRGFDTMDRVILFLNKFQEHVSVIHLDERHMTCINADKNRLVEPSALCLLEDGRVVISEKERVKIFRINDYELLAKPKQSYPKGLKSWLPLEQLFKITVHLRLVTVLGLGLVFAIIVNLLIVYIFL